MHRLAICDAIVFFFNFMLFFVYLVRTMSIFLFLFFLNSFFTMASLLFDLIGLQSELLIDSVVIVLDDWPA